MSEESAKFSGWAIVEIMGHSKEIGFVTTEYFGGPALFRIDQPSLAPRTHELTRAQWVNDKLCDIGTRVERVELPGKTTYVGPSAIFRLTPCTEETARRGVEELIPVPMKILHLVERKQINAGPSPAYDDFDDAEQI